MAPPYRLDLTVNVLRRLATNLVDVLTSDGTYLRLLGDPADGVVVRVRQPSPESLTIGIEADPREHPRLLALVRRMLGVEKDLTRFYASAASIAWLHPLVHRMSGVRPPRYPTLWEACVNAIVFQQVSLAAASAIMGRLTVALGAPVKRDGVQLYHFPSAARFRGAADGVLRVAGLSAGKLATLRRVGDALDTAAFDPTRFELLPSADAAALLQRIKGIGPWTATVILIRGTGRLDVFPANDSSVARNLALVGGSEPVDLDGALQRLGPDRGMLYYHLLLARLEARAALGLAPVATVPQRTRRAGA
ncbi:MAG: hypothetical protein ABI587_13015 [Gemmatimonadales bacterium]